MFSHTKCFLIATSEFTIVRKIALRAPETCSEMRFILKKYRYMLHAWFVDHACLRFFWSNKDKISSNSFALRSGHPSLSALKKFKREGGKYVLNLRGGRKRPANLIEKCICKREGLKLINIPLRSSRAPSKKSILELIEFFQNVDAPFLVHCKTGADRTGLAAAIYLLSIDDCELEDAIKQLHIRYLHFGFGEKKILKKFFEYLGATRSEPQSLYAWARDTYEPSELIDWITTKNEIVK